MPTILKQHMLSAWYVYKNEMTQILVFKRSARLFAFSTKGDDYRNKEQINARQNHEDKIWYVRFALLRI